MKYTEQLLDQFLNELVATYKQLLIDDGKVASGNLVNSIHANSVSETQDGYDLSISAVDYAKFVEDGRKPGKFPPPPAIQSWVNIKFPGETQIRQNQLSYLIGRKIAMYGIKPGNYLQKAIDIVYPKYFNERFDEALQKDLQLI